MLFSCMRAELMKLKRSFIWVVFLILPLISTVMGCANYLQNVEILDSLWYSLWTQTTLFHCRLLRLPLACGKFQPQPQCPDDRPRSHSHPVFIPVSGHCLRHSADPALGGHPVLHQRPRGGYDGFSAYTDLLLAAERLFRGTGHSRPAAVALLLHQKLCPSHSNRLTGQYSRPSFFLQGSGTLLSLFPHAPGHEFQPGRRYPLRFLPALSVKLHHFPAAFCTAGNRVPEEIGCKSIIPFFLKRAALFGRSSYLPGKSIHLRVLYL